MIRSVIRHPSRLRAHRKSDSRFLKRPFTPSQRKSVKRMINFGRELKYFVAFETAVSISTTATVDDLFEPAIGDTDITRDGDQVTLRGIVLRFTLTGGDLTNIIRIICFQWRADSALQAPNAGNIIISTGDINSPLNHDQRTNYRILYDKRFTTCGTTAAPTEATIRLGMVKQSAKNWAKTVYFDSGGLQGRNKIYILYLSDSAAITHPTISYRSLIEFNDS